MKAFNMDRLVELQIKKWQKRRSLNDTKLKVASQPVITLSRQHGANGLALGKLLAQHLEYDVWDREVLVAMAEHAHVSTQLLESMDEHPKNAIAEFARNFVHSKAPSNREYMGELCRQILVIAHHGRAVVIGRGAQLIIEHDAALRIRVVAPLEDRIDQVMRDSGTNEREAREEITRIDTEHAAFIQENWGKDINDFYLYSLIVNTKDLGVEGAVATICAAYRERFGQVAKA